MPCLETTVFEALEKPLSAINLEVTRVLARLRPAYTSVALEISAFDLDDFARAGRCAVSPLPNVPVHQRAYLDERQTKLLTFCMQAWRKVEWEGQTLEVVTLSWGNDTCPEAFHWVLARSAELAHRFIVAVCTSGDLSAERLLVFENGVFRKSRMLAESVSQARFEDVVLQGTLADDLRADARRFFERRAFYEAHRLPWKRGLLLVGPPGNGKTQTLKALLHELQRPTVYVKSFHSRGETEDNIRKVFERARQAAPAVMVLEDLDCLVEERCRSVFLNELDGFALNSGLLVIATTNHPEKLDRSILDRPSRFDRKFHFPLPGEGERRLYLARWNAEQREVMRLSAAGVEAVVKATRGFTYAYLKELMLSAALRWVDDARPGAMDGFSAQAARELSAQMASAAVLLGPVEKGRTIGFSAECAE
ncbi:MAG: ATP-binding protein [Archangiaceae bacterium]|nr:ATP-binding protein [Archangiaceae bacterium]